MKDTNIISLGFRVCPKCGSRYHEPPAFSRVDNQTLICPDCGTREALATMGVDEKEQEEILASIHGCRQEF